MSARHRSWSVIAEERSKACNRTAHSLRRLNPEHVLWISELDPPAPFVRCLPHQVRTHLGRSYDVVVLELYSELNADIVGQAHGFVWGGGTFIFLVPEDCPTTVAYAKPFLVHPYTEADVGCRFPRRFLETILMGARTLASEVQPAVHSVHGSEEQAALVIQLGQKMADREPSATLLMADRGRGKSSALGLALSALETSERVVVTAASEDACREIYKFAGQRDSTRETPAFMSPDALVDYQGTFDIIVVDEAAQISVDTLKKIALRFSDARMIFSTTVHGYEGTGRGFVLRFCEWLSERHPNYETLQLREPIRWAQGDPFEDMIRRTLLLDAKPNELTLAPPAEEIVATVLDREALVKDEALLSQFFGLLVHAHYRTTPGDLHRILDAPNMRIHALLHGSTVLGATLVALEGTLPESLCAEVQWGRKRLRGQALAETLLSHSSRPDAGRLSIVRSVRIAVHPAVRRLGLASRLVRHVHDTYRADLFGTLFGATPELLAFRRSLGYHPIRLGTSRGRRTGVRSVVMVRPASPEARVLVDSLRRVFAREFTSQGQERAQTSSSGSSGELQRALTRDLLAPMPYGEAERDLAVATYAFGPRTLENVVAALQSHLEHHKEGLHRLSPNDSELLQRRILRGETWATVAETMQLGSVPATMRATRRAFRQFVKEVSPHLLSLKPTFSDAGMSENEGTPQQ